jgi:hypothetical protein
MFNNPYYEHAIQADPAMFYGREKEIQTISRMLKKKQCISIVGQRRIGKSSLLFHLCDKKCNRKYFSDHENYLFVYIDLLEIGDAGLQGFFQTSYNATLKVSGGKLPIENKKISNYAEFNAFLEEINLAGFVLVLCLDEFEGLINPDAQGLDKVFFRYLRSLGNDHQLLMVTSSRDYLYNICLQNEGSAVSELWNIFPILQLSLFSTTDAIRLIREPSERAGYKFSENDVEFVLKNAGPHPFFIQMVCYHLLNSYNAHTLGLLDYEAISNNLYVEALPYIEDVWRGLSQEEKGLLMGNKSLIESRDRILTSLRGKAILDEHNQIFAKIFTDFLREKRRLDLLSKGQSKNIPPSVQTAEANYINQLLSLQFGFDDVLGLELRGISNYRDLIHLKLWTDKEIEEIRVQSKDLVNLSTWRISVNVIGKQLFSKLSSSQRIVSIFNQAFPGPNEIEKTRIVYRIPRELIHLPLEWLIVNDVITIPEHIPLTILCPISKYVTGVLRKLAPISISDLQRPETKMLFLASNAHGRVEVGPKSLELPYIPGVDDEVSEIESIYQEARRQGLIKFHARFIHTGELSAAEIVKEISSGYDWIHYSGHGWFDEMASDQSSLFFFKDPHDGGAIDTITAKSLQQILKSSGTRGVYLSSCLGASIAPQLSLVYTDFLGIMDGLVVASIPTIIGMRWPIPDATAKLLSKEFYQAWFTGMPLDYSVYLAKKALYTQTPTDPTWASIVLIHQIE